MAEYRRGNKEHMGYSGYPIPMSEIILPTALQPQIPPKERRKRAIQARSHEVRNFADKLQQEVGVKTIRSDSQKRLSVVVDETTDMEEKVNVAVKDVLRRSSMFFA